MEIESDNQLHMASKLTSDRVKLPVGRHMKVNIAAQMLSQTCTAAIRTFMYTYICSSQMNDRAIGTTNVIFDMGNGISPNAPAHKLAMSPTNKMQMVTEMRKADHWLATWQLEAM